MIQAKEVSVRNLVVYLIMAAALTGTYVVLREHQATRTAAPVFIGSEITVKESAKAVPARVVVTATPAPVLPSASPLPIMPPSVIVKVLPTYPAQAVEEGRNGIVLLSVYIGLSGKPERIETKTSSGFGDLDDAAQKAVAQWQFTPASQGGASLASWFEVPVRFTIK